MGAAAPLTEALAKSTTQGSCHDCNNLILCDVWQYLLAMTSLISRSVGNSQEIDTRINPGIPAMVFFFACFWQFLSAVASVTGCSLEVAKGFHTRPWCCRLLVASPGDARGESKTINCSQSKICPQKECPPKRLTGQERQQSYLVKGCCLGLLYMCEPFPRLLWRSGAELGRTCSASGSHCAERTKNLRALLTHLRR